MKLTGSEPTFRPANSKLSALAVQHPAVPKARSSPFKRDEEAITSARPLSRVSDISSLHRCTRLSSDRQVRLMSGGVKIDWMVVYTHNPSNRPSGRGTRDAPHSGCER